MKRKLIGVMLAGVMLLSFAGCGGSDTSAESKVKTEEKQESVAENTAEKETEEETESYEEFYWPTVGIAQILPVPESNVGKIVWEESDSFSIQVAETSIDAYRKYVDTCIEKGFDDYSRYDDMFTAKDASGNDLTVLRLEGDVMSVRIEAGKEEEGTETTD